MMINLAKDLLKRADELEAKGEDVTLIRQASTEIESLRISRQRDAALMNEAADKIEELRATFRDPQPQVGMPDEHPAQ